MNQISKMLTLALFTGFLVATPLFARDCKKKCSIVGAYNGTLTTQSSLSVVAQFDEGGTMTLYLPGFSTPFVGTWKNVGSNCFEFCATSVLSLLENCSSTDCGELNARFRNKITGSHICFEDADCQHARGMITLTLGYALDDLTMTGATTAPPFDGSLILQRPVCK